jgi:hypothetical protein
LYGERRRKEVPRRDVGKGKAADMDLMYVMAPPVSRPFAIHPSLSKQRVHVKRLGYGRPSAGDAA